MTDGLATRVAPAISVLGGGFMMSRYAKAVAEENGFANPWTSYLAGRCGVLGEVAADVVLASVFFYHPQTLRLCWAERRASGLPPELATERFRQACFAWGRGRLEGFVGAARLADLLEPLVDRADPRAAPLFAGWRAVARPETGDDLARVALAAHQVREYRMAMHVVAVRSLQMDPLEAILSGDGGEGNAAFFSWPPPYPDVSHLTAARRDVEDLTNTLTEPLFDALTPSEADELVTLTDEATQLSFRR